MAVDTGLAKLYLKDILSRLLQAGFSQADCAKTLQYIEESIYDEVTADVLHNMTAEEQEEWEKANDEQLSPEEISDLLGVSEADLMEQYLLRLEDFMEHFEENLPTLKQKLQQEQQTPPVSQ